MTAKQLKQALRRLGWSQRYCSKQIGVSQAAMSRWVNGGRRVPRPVALLMELILANNKRNAA